MKVIAETILKSILVENRIKTIKDKFPELKDGTGESPIIDYFVANDPSGNNKYLEWMAKAMVHKPTTDFIMKYIGDWDWEQFRIWGGVAGLISQVVNHFHSLLPFITYTDNEGKEHGSKDLYSYKLVDDTSIQRLMSDLNDAFVRKKSNEEFKKARKESDRIYEDDNWLVVRPKSWESSCAYGAGTKWCTTSKSSDVHFKRETSGYFLIYVINKKETLDDNLNKVAWQIPYKKNYNNIIEDDGDVDVDFIKLWNREDDNFAPRSFNYLKEIPVDIILKIKSYIQNLINIISADKGFNEDPKIQAIMMSAGNDVTVVQNNYNYYGLNVYRVVDEDGDVREIAVGDDPEVEAAKREWVEMMYDGVDDAEIASGLHNPENYIQIDNINFIAREDARYRIEDMDDDDILELGMGYTRRLDKIIEDHEINKGIFETNQSRIDELELKEEELTPEETEELTETIKENTELEKDLERQLKNIREILFNIYYNEQVSRMENDPLDWLSEFGYYNRKTKEFDKDAFNSMISLDRERLFMDYAQDTSVYGLSNTGEVDEVNYQGVNYYLIEVE